MVNRRTFLQCAAGAVAGVAWSQKLMASPYGMPVGIELYTVRHEMVKDPAGTIQQLAQIGFKEVEIIQFDDKPSHPAKILGMSGKEFAKLLRDNGMRAPSGHYSMEHTQTNWAPLIEQAHDIGLEYMTNAWIDEEYRSSMDGWKRVVDLLNKAAEPVQKAGMTYNYHNHNFEFVTIENTFVYDYLIKNLDPKIHFTLDCYWTTRAGQDPVKLMQRLSGRVAILHIKDMPNSLPVSYTYDGRKENFAAIGQGVIDWNRIFRAAPTGGVKHYYYEQDSCTRPPLESAKISFDYLNQLSV
jgi:sugar phosphate isomerase/epimerase